MQAFYLISLRFLSSNFNKKMEHKLSTKCVHAGGHHKGRGVNQAIETSSAFRYRNQKVVYPRYFNTSNQNATVNKLCALENGDNGLLFASGMAAISTVLYGFLKPGDHILVSSHVYGGTYNLVKGKFKNEGIQFDLIDGVFAADFEAEVKPNTKVIYIETPSNPLLTLLDVEGIAKMAKDKGIITVIDNTFASPINQRPLELGIDIVIHSGTKYLGGHSDLCFGAAIMREKCFEAVYKQAICLGGSINALDTYLIDRSLKTLDLRVSRQTENAMVIAKGLEEREFIGKVYYPGLETHENHDLARKQMHGFGAMLSFELNLEDAYQRDAFFDHLDLVTPAVSLGGVETLVCEPVATSHVLMPKSERDALGIFDHLLRLSVGIEAPSDILADIDQAVKKALQANWIA